MTGSLFYQTLLNRIGTISTPVPRPTRTVPRGQRTPSRLVPRTPLAPNAGERLLRLTFASCGYLIGTPLFHLRQRPFGKTLHITLFYLRRYAFTPLPVLTLVRRLVSLYQCHVELDCTRLYHEQAEGSLLAQSLGLRSYKSRFLRLVSTLFKQTPLFSERAPRDSDPLSPSRLAGLKIRLGGRTFRQRIVPRKTAQVVQRGSLARTKVALVERGTFTHHTKRGTYRFTVRLSHPHTLPLRTLTGGR